MADYDIGMDEFGRDDDIDDDDIDDDIDNDNETPFIETPAGEEIGGATNTISLSQELVKSTVDDYYNSFAEDGTVPSVGHDYSKFELDRFGRLRLKASNIPIVNMRTGKSLSLRTIAGNRGGGQM